MNFFEFWRLLIGFTQLYHVHCTGNLKIRSLQNLKKKFTKKAKIWFDHEFFENAFHLYLFTLPPLCNLFVYYFVFCLQLFVYIYSGTKRRGPGKTDQDLKIKKPRMTKVITTLKMVKTGRFLILFIYIFGAVCLLFYFFLKKGLRRSPRLSECSKCFKWEILWWKWLYSGQWYFKIFFLIYE